MAKVDLEALERDGTSDVGSSQALLREEKRGTCGKKTPSVLDDFHLFCCR